MCVTAEITRFYCFSSPKVAFIITEQPRKVDSINCLNFRVVARVYFFEQTASHWLEIYGLVYFPLSQVSDHNIKVSPTFRR